LINQYKKSKEPNYCVRVTANDGALGKQYLREFQDNEKTVPTILTTPQKLSTGVDVRNIRNIVLMRPITREARVAEAQSNIFALLNNKQKEFLEFVLSKYIETGVEELDEEKLPDLLTLKYYAIKDASEMLGGVENIRTTFFDFQKYLYERKMA